MAMSRQARNKYTPTQLFSKSHLHIPDIINFVITYAKGQSLWKCAQTAGVGYGSTAVDWAVSAETYSSNIIFEISRTKCYKAR